MVARGRGMFPGDPLQKKAKTNKHGRREEVGVDYCESRKL